jgi:hypothetical protein
MATQELSDYVTGLSTASLDGAKELYLQTDEKTTVGALKVFTTGKVYKAQISQSGTSAPTLNVLVDDFGLTLSPSYTGVGVYEISGFATNLTGLIETNLTTYSNTASHILSSLSSSILKIETFDSGVATNGMLINSGTSVGSSVLTIVKYD